MDDSKACCALLDDVTKRNAALDEEYGVLEGQEGEACRARLVDVTKTNAALVEEVEGKLVSTFQGGEACPGFPDECRQHSTLACGKGLLIRNAGESTDELAAAAVRLCSSYIAVHSHPQRI